MRGKFIVIEGLDGSGKSTQAKKLSENLKNSLLTREPSDGSVGSLCRSAFSGTLELTHSTIRLLLVADRIEHIDKVVIPALESGQNIVCDRYYLSNMAYQADSEQCMQEIYELNKKFSALKPDLTIFLALEPSSALERIKSRSDERSIFEDLQTLAKIDDNYKKAIAFLKEQGENIIEIPANCSENEVATEVFKALKSL